MRGIYGQAEGNESRSKNDTFADHCRANEIAEGDYIVPMERLAQRGKMREMAELRDKMKADYIRQGVKPELAQQRADAVLSGASRLLRLK